MVSCICEILDLMALYNRYKSLGILVVMAFLAGMDTWNEIAD